MNARKWAFIAGLLQGLLLWMKEHIEREQQREERKRLKKLRKRQERAGQPL